MLLAIGKNLTEIHDRLRLAKDKLFIPLVKVMPHWMTPNRVTWFRTMIALIWLPYAVLSPNLFQISLFLIIYYFDLLDGAVARLTDRVTYFGEYFDHISDKFNNVALLITLNGLTSYNYSGITYFIIWDSAMTILLLIDYFRPDHFVSYVRTPLDLVAKIFLWVFLIVKILPVFFLGAI